MNLTGQKPGVEESERPPVSKHLPVAYYYIQRTHRLLGAYILHLGKQVLGRECRYYLYCISLHPGILLVDPRPTV